MVGNQILPYMPVTGNDFKIGQAIYGKDLGTV